MSWARWCACGWRPGPHRWQALRPATQMATRYAAALQAAGQSGSGSGSRGGGGDGGGAATAGSWGGGLLGDAALQATAGAHPLAGRAINAMRRAASGGHDAFRSVSGLRAGSCPQWRWL